MAVHFPFPVSSQKGWEPEGTESPTHRPERVGEEVAVRNHSALGMPTRVTPFPEGHLDSCLELSLCPSLSVPLT